MEQEKPKREDLSRLRKIAYSKDSSRIEGKASSVLIPEKIEEVQKAVKTHTNIVTRGGGSGLAGGAVPLNSLLIDLSKLNKISNLDEEKGTIEVEAGVVLDELNNFLSKYNLEFPVQPASHAIATIGGMISTNAVGERGVKYGKTGNWVKELEIIDSMGELKKLSKAEASDYIGMEGITGIIAGATLNLVNKKQRTASLLRFEVLSQVIEKVKQLKLDAEVSSIEFLDKMVSDILNIGQNYHLIIEYESDKGSLKGQAYKEIMEMRESVPPILASLGYTETEDPKLYIGKMEEFLEFLESNKVPTCGHIGIGILHPRFIPSQKEKIKATLDLVKSLHGQVSGEHGIGLRKKEYLDETEKKLIRVIKNRLDPTNKFNSGKMIDVEEKQDDN